MGKGYVGIAILIAGVLIGGAYLSRQQRVAHGQEPALHVSEAGLEYILHVLNSGTCTPEEVSAQQPIVQRVAGEGDTDSLGTFSVAVNQSSDGKWRFTSTGQVGGLMGTCTQSAATLDMFSGVLGTKYRAESAGVGMKVRCGAVPAPTELHCSDK